MKKLVSFVIILWLGVVLVQFIVFDDLAKRGQFGDMFGAVYGRFSGLAFAVIYRSRLNTMRSKSRRLNFGSR